MVSLLDYTGQNMPSKTQGKSEDTAADPIFHQVSQWRRK